MRSPCGRSGYRVSFRFVTGRRSKKRTRDLVATFPAPRASKEEETLMYQRTKTHFTWLVLAGTVNPASQAALAGRS